MNSLPGSESHQETPDPSAKGNAFGQGQEALRSDLRDSEAADPGLLPVWRDAQGHDEWCEGDWDQSAGRYHLCGCGQRAASGIYPDGRRSPE